MSFSNLSPTKQQFPHSKIEKTKKMPKVNSQTTFKTSLVHHEANPTISSSKQCLFYVQTCIPDGNGKLVVKRKREKQENKKKQDKFATTSSSSTSSPNRSPSPSMPYDTSLTMQQQQQPVINLSRSLCENRNNVEKKVAQSSQTILPSIRDILVVDCSLIPQVSNLLPCVRSMITEVPQVSHSSYMF